MYHPNADTLMNCMDLKVQEEVLEKDVMFELKIKTPFIPSMLNLKLCILKLWIQITVTTQIASYLTYLHFIVF